MDLFTPITAENLADRLFIPSSEKQAQLEALSNQALSNGIDLYMKKQYQDAANEFQRSISLSPTSPFSADATKYLASAYLKLKQTDKAIEAYKNSFRYNPDRDDLHTNLGNLYFSMDRYKEAVIKYKEAVRINPDANNHFSLGQGYLHTGNLVEAKTEFNEVLRLEPERPIGYYGIGKLYSKQGYYERAVEKFEKAVRLDNEFYDAHAEIGYAYADMGEIEKAQEMVEFLEDKNASLSETLSSYINSVEPPKILFAWGSSTFGYYMSVNTPVSALDSYLENASASKSMTMIFRFNKEMDRSSVENRFNWTIERATGGGAGEAYNFGQPIPDTEITIETYPDYVLYNSDIMSTTVSFTINQNETADGTIDPSHIKFKFNGNDAYGNTIDTDYDEFTGFSKVA